MSDKILGKEEFKFGSGKYFQFPGASFIAGREARHFGKKVYLIGGRTALSLISDRLKRSFADEGIAFEEEYFEGHPSIEKILQLQEAVMSSGCDVIMAVGGGRCIDLAKAAAANLSVPIITVPTSAATCAAFAPLSVIYHSDGSYDHCIWHEREVDVVLADSDILLREPRRLFASGILDAMAKYIEISNGENELNLDNTSLPLLTASHLARFVYDLLTETAIPAVCSANKESEASLSDERKALLKRDLEYTVFLNIALTGIVSGITKGKGQTSVAHAFYNSMRSLFPSETSPYLHGEIVAVGTIAQLVFNGCEKDISTLKKCMASMGMPCSVSEMGIKLSDRDMSYLYKSISEKRFMVHDDIHEERLRKALEEVR